MSTGMTLSDSPPDNKGVTWWLPFGVTFCPYRTDTRFARTW